jgi:hypothetical protein
MAGAGTDLFHPQRCLLHVFTRVAHLLIFMYVWRILRLAILDAGLQFLDAFEHVFLR